LNPETYYGSTQTVETLAKGTKLYVGNFNRVEEFIVEDIKFDEKLNSYEIYTDEAILLAVPLTRISCSGS
jgi:hypothetical protein